MKNARFALSALGALALFSGCGLAPEEKLQEAQSSYDAHDYAGAKVYLVSALKDRPGDAATLTMLARTQIAMGDGEGAVVSLNQVNPANARSDEWRTLYAEAELLRGNFAEALATLGEPKTAEAARIAALARLASDDTVLAEQIIEAGVSLPGNKAGLLAARAQIELSKGDFAAAAATAQRALAADPESIDALLASARANQAQNKLPATLSAFEKAARLYPQNFAAQYGKIAALAEMGRLDVARGSLSVLAELAPDSVDVVHLQARIALEDDEPQKARELLQGYEAALRDDPSIRATYATALLRVGQASQARALLAPLVSDFPQRRELSTLLAEAELATGDAKKALATIRPLAERPDAQPLELDVAAKAAKSAGDRAASRYAARAKSATPEWIGGELAKADAALRNRQWREAVISYEAINARAAEPNAMILNNLAYAKSQLGQTDDALRIALNAVTIAPDHPAILDTAGWLLVESGSDRARGIAMLEKASRLDPENARIAQRLRSAKQG